MERTRTARAFDGEFESVARLLAVSSNEDDVLRLSLQRVNQSGGFRVDHFEHSIERWITMWGNQKSRVPCPICCDFLPQEMYHEMQRAASTAATAATVVSEIAIALHDFTPSTSMSTDDATRKISIQRGQRLRVIKHGQNGWTQGVCESTGERGWFPTSYVRVQSNNGGLTAGHVH